MSLINRRKCLEVFLGGMLQATGTVVLASTVLPGASRSETPDRAEPATKDLEQRADRLAEALLPPPEGDGEEFCSFLNGAFRNTGGGGFRNGAFTNGGGFRNGAFANGGFHNGGFVNGGFHNGGFANGGGFRNAAFRNAN
jgi:hypothetical protein